MADKETKSTMREFAANDQADYYLGITSIKVNGKNSYELKGKFLDDLHKNAFSGTNREDAVEHIEYFLKIIDPIDLPNVNRDKLRVVVFPISLDGDAWRWIETNLFDYETPLCKKFKEFNYLLKIDPNLLTKDIEGFKTYDEYKDDWIYEWNENDSEMKEEALRNKAIMEGLIDDDDDESSNNGWRRWDGYKITDHDREKREYENEHNNEERCELFNDHELPVCTIRRFEMIKYSFRQDEEYVAIKEDEYEDLTNPSKDACRAYQEIFRMMDEGWKVTSTE
ncbi:hypothetical protein Tco_0271383 [Tanacetum coccineum]